MTDQLSSFPTTLFVDSEDTTTTVSDVHRAVYTVLEVAKLLSLSRGNTYAMVRSGEIPALKLGSRWVIPRRRFHEWLDSLGDQPRPH